MRDSDRQSEFPAGYSPLRGPRGDKQRGLQASWWARAFAALMVCAAAVGPSSAQTITTLHSFDGGDGEFPSAGLIQGIDGNLYGTTEYGGANYSCFPQSEGCGTVFKISPAGKLTTLYSFCSKTNCTDGENPHAGLVQAGDGNFYGTTGNGGSGNGGTVFRITPSGKLTTLYSFCSQSNCADGLMPLGPLIQSIDGSLYGTTSAGGIVSPCDLVNGQFYGCGTVFKITLAGTLTTLHSFCSHAACADGTNPVSGLLLAKDGNFYGTAEFGGFYNDGDGFCLTNGCGTVFRMTAGGTLTTLHSFCSPGFCSDGANPAAGLIQAANGSLYGTTFTGGYNCNSGCGTIFAVTPSGTLTTVYKFSGTTDGDGPLGALIQGTDGNFYGTTVFGYEGTVFWITPSGSLTTLKFEGTDGGFPEAGLVQDTNGQFYGTASEGGTSGVCEFGCGTVFRLSAGLRPFIETYPTSAKVGKPINILGSNLTNASSVTFNGTAATFSVKSPSLITTTVPAGATSGTVHVVTPGGTLSSNVPFRVIP